MKDGVDGLGEIEKPARRLDNVVRRTRFERGLVVTVTGPREDDNRGARLSGSNRADDVEPVARFETQLGDHHIVVIGLQRFQEGFLVRGLGQGSEREEGLKHGYRLGALRAIAVDQQ